MRRALVGESFDDNYVQTYGCDFSVKTVEVEGGLVKFSIWDVAGQIDYSSVHPTYFFGAAAAVIVYDVTNLSSYNSVLDWLDRFLALCGYERSVVAVVGNKVDLVDKVQVDESMHDALLTQIMRVYSDRLYHLEGLRTTAKAKEEIGLLFVRLGSKIMENLPLVPRVEMNASLDKVIPGVLHVMFHELWGPYVVASTPLLEELGPHDRLMANVGRLFSSFDFESTVSRPFQSGKIPWTDPLGVAIFFAFSRASAKARGGHELHVLVILVAAAYVPRAAKKEGILTAYCHSAMNRIISVLSGRYRNLSYKVRDFPDEELRYLISPILSQLRNDLYLEILDL